MAKSTQPKNRSDVPSQNVMVFVGSLWYVNADKHLEVVTKKREGRPSYKTSDLGLITKASSLKRAKVNWRNKHGNCKIVEQPVLVIGLDTGREYWVDPTKSLDSSFKENELYSKHVGVLHPVMDSINNDTESVKAKAGIVLFGVCECVCLEHMLLQRLHCTCYLRHPLMIHTHRTDP